MNKIRHAKESSGWGSANVAGITLSAIKKAVQTMTAEDDSTDRNRRYPNRGARVITGDPGD